MLTRAVDDLTGDEIQIALFSRVPPEAKNKAWCLPVPQAVSSRARAMFRFVGILMGISFRHKVSAADYDEEEFSYKAFIHSAFPLLCLHTVLPSAAVRWTSGFPSLLCFGSY